MSEKTKKATFNLHLDVLAALDKAMAELEKDYILRALDMAHGSKQRTARLLGITMRSLRYRMSKLGLEAFSGELP